MSKVIALSATAAVVLGLGATFAIMTGGTSLEDCGATAVAGGDIGGSFELLDSNGDLVTDEELITEPVLIYFGYTFCPDFCPMDMARNATAVDILADQGIDAKPVFISIDPRRDTPEVVGDYAYNFHDKAVGLTGTADQVDAASKAYRTYYKAEEAVDDYYLVQHTTFSYLTLPEVGFVEFFRSDATPESVAETVACYVAAT